MGTVETYYGAYSSSDFPCYVQPSAGKAYFVHPEGLPQEMLDYLAAVRDFKGEPDTWAPDPEFVDAHDGLDGSVLYTRFRSDGDWWMWSVQSTKP